MHIQINSLNKNKTHYPALFNLGFRVFFLGAAIFSIISIALWSAIYLFDFRLPMVSITSAQWHAHEMIYGYSLAVIAGFLLTAINNWTGLKTQQGIGLMLLFSLWAIARLLFLGGTSMLFAAAIFDLLFSLFLLYSLARPIIKVRQWKQLSILLILVLLIISNIMFYLGAFTYFDDGVYIGIYGGLYLIIAVILIMGRRVVPFFIEKGVDDDVTLRNIKWVDIAIPVFFIGFIVAELFLRNPTVTSSFAITLLLLTSIRLAGWYTAGLWNKCLLWSLYLSFCFISLGFALIASSYILGTAKSLAIHAFTYGGIGVITVAMMSRVALGHTGREVKHPPKIVSYALAILIAGAVIRVVLPLFDLPHYLQWIGLSQLLWIIGFALFVFTYLPILTKPRPDGQPG